MKQLMSMGIKRLMSMEIKRMMSMEIKKCMMKRKRRRRESDLKYLMLN